MEKGSVNGGSVRLSTPNLEGTRRLSAWRNGTGTSGGDGDDTSSLSGTGIEVPKRKSSLGRKPSLTKGFL
ncbi:uncharacterized protein F4822DRAFT_389776 [Hypoxylon trugodes]|uniref:uncharacterized protein n=1 Tax=Hypoxylon trugodes TaxID=326681 RepID=UPI00219FDA68|nr:uncharacterized protein F4822DRAFT_389776 [Hypoxylon trugodes]KAI1392154.1 hypothetical protein F4822DRAFT_389776 [Hypoxylon trugodes]